MNYKEIEEQVEEDLNMQRKLAMEGVHAPLNVPFVMAPVGTGKSALAKHFAEDVFCLPMVKINLGENSSSVEMTGLPDLMNPGRFLGVEDLVDDDEELELASTAQFTRWSFNEVIEHAINFGTFLFIDDADKAPPPLQAALLALTAERTVRDRKLHKKTLIMLAGNRVTDDVLANEISESLLTRTTPMVLDYGLTDFQRYSAETGLVHPTVMGFISHKPEYLHRKPAGQTTDFRFPTPRGWEEVSHHLFHFDTLKLDPVELARRRRNLIARKIGNSTLADWTAWADVLNLLNLDVLFKTGELQAPAANASQRQYISVAAAVMMATKARDNGVQSVPGLASFLEDNNITKESRVVCFSLLSEEDRADLMSIYPNINFLQLFSGLGLIK